MENRIGNSTAVSLHGDVAVSGEYNVIFTVEFREPLSYLILVVWDSDPPTMWNTQMVSIFSITVVTAVNCFDNSP